MNTNQEYPDFTLIPNPQPPTRPPSEISVYFEDEDPNFEYSDVYDYTGAMNLEQGVESSSSDGPPPPTGHSQVLPPTTRVIPSPPPYSLQVDECLGFANQLSQLPNENCADSRRRDLLDKINEYSPETQLAVYVKLSPHQFHFLKQFELAGVEVYSNISDYQVKQSTRRIINLLHDISDHECSANEGERLFYEVLVEREHLSVNMWRRVESSLGQLNRDEIGTRQSKLSLTHLERIKQLVNVHEQEKEREVDTLLSRVERAVTLADGMIHKLVIDHLRCEDASMYSRAIQCFREIDEKRPNSMFKLSPLDSKSSDINKVTLQSEGVSQETAMEFQVKAFRETLALFTNPDNMSNTALLDQHIQRLTDQLDIHGDVYQELTVGEREQCDRLINLYGLEHSWQVRQYRAVAEAHRIASETGASNKEQIPTSTTVPTFASTSQPSTSTTVSDLPSTPVSLQTVIQSIQAYSQQLQQQNPVDPTIPLLTAWVQTLQQNHSVTPQGQGVVSQSGGNSIDNLKAENALLRERMQLLEQTNQLITQVNNNLNSLLNSQLSYASVQRVGSAEVNRKSEQPSTDNRSRGNSRDDKEAAELIKKLLASQHPVSSAPDTLHTDKYTIEKSARRGISCDYTVKDSNDNVLLKFTSNPLTLKVTESRLTEDNYDDFATLRVQLRNKEPLKGAFAVPGADQSSYSNRTQHIIDALVAKASASTWAVVQVKSENFDYHWMAGKDGKVCINKKVVGHLDENRKQVYLPILMVDSDGTTISNMSERDLLAMERIAGVEVSRSGGRDEKERNGRDGRNEGKNKARNAGGNSEKGKNFPTSHQNVAIPARLQNNAISFVEENPSVGNGTGGGGRGRQIEPE